MARTSRSPGSPDRRAIRRLAEAILLQATEDLWSTSHRAGSLSFFAGQAFDDCAAIIGLNVHEKRDLLRLAEKALRSRPHPHLLRAWQGRSYHHTRHHP